MRDPTNDECQLLAAPNGRMIKGVAPSLLPPCQSLGEGEASSCGRSPDRATQRARSGDRLERRNRPKGGTPLKPCPKRHKQDPAAGPNPLLFTCPVQGDQNRRR